MAVITIVKDLTFVGDNGQSWNTDWISFPAEHQNATLTVVVKSRIGGSNINVQLRGSYDTDSETNIGTAITTGAPGTTTQDINTGLTPMVRVLLTANANSQLVISIYLTPKST